MTLAPSAGMVKGRGRQGLIAGVAEEGFGMKDREREANHMPVSSTSFERPVNACAAAWVLCPDPWAPIEAMPHPDHR